ncbi:hypothetical protein GRX03_05965 [Halovenus sp. WSH3]|uniref:Small CPxCG-related zinc finger protein n=1 Tax=Halovenus carboxidivorans TaxID=2692199 RepID=A0A6B0T777_9EURY|nr:hypothetical protein [Halovenus carboxidivorans]MXR51152.1 hypothetical protein [Halovenus carboxidivorans]
MTERTYRCSNCLEWTVTRDFDVSHLSITCGECDEFARFINDDVFEQYRAFEETPPEHLNWEKLSRAEKFLVSNGVVREGRSIEDFEIEEA